MIRIFDDHLAAISFAIEYNLSNDHMMALRHDGSALWIKGDQVLFFPVLMLKKLPVMKALELFQTDLGYESAEIEIIRETLEAICRECPQCRVLTIGRWSMEIWIPAGAEADAKPLIERLRMANDKIAESLGERWGRMKAVSPQPDGFYRENRIYKLGIQ